MLRNEFLRHWSQSCWATGGWHICLWYRQRRKKILISSSQPRTLRCHSFTTLLLGLLRKFLCIFVVIVFWVLYEERGNARVSGKKSLSSKLQGLSTVTLIKNLNDLNYNWAIISRARSKWWGLRSDQQSINMFSVFFSLPPSSSPHPKCFFSVQATRILNQILRNTLNLIEFDRFWVRKSFSYRTEYWKSEAAVLISECSNPADLFVAWRKGAEKILWLKKILNPEKSK